MKIFLIHNIPSEKFKGDSMSELNNSFSKLEELEKLASETLLVDLLNKKKAEVFENVVFSGKKRYYIEDLTERDYSLENTTPYQIEILDNPIEAHSWGAMLCQIANLLLKLFPDYLSNIMEFKCGWSKAAMFSKETKTNYKSINYGLYMNCNHTALHACWVIQDLLDFFKIDKSTVKFLIHRPCSAEPAHVKEYIEKRFKRGFIEYLMIYYKRTEEQANKIITVIEKYLNPMLTKISKSYTNWFLFDDNATMVNYVKKIKEQITFSIKFDEKARKILNKSLDLLWKYYKV